MPKTAIKIGPKDNGRRMSLADFEFAEGEPGYLYELSRGVITVMDVPGRRHPAQYNAVRRQLNAYDLANPGRIDTIAGGGECKLLVGEPESERHPDFSLYRTPMPPEGNLWAIWIPDLVIEIVSPGSEHRDYVEKREEYLRLGVREYWIIDHARVEMLVLRRSHDQWVERVIRPPQVYRTRLLPGLKFDLAAVFAAADQVEE